MRKRVLFIVQTKNLHGDMMASYDNYAERLKRSNLVVIEELVESPKMYSHLMEVVIQTGIM